MALTENVIKLVAALAWPVTALLGCIIFYRPLTGLVSTLAQRVQKFSVFKVDIELGSLKNAVSLQATVGSLSKKFVNESDLMTIVGGVAKSGSADYLIVNIGDTGDDWLTSRLFLLAVLLERSPEVRCLVFLDGTARYLGAASPKDVRRLLGARYPAYEQALAASYGGIPPISNMFLNGLNEQLVIPLASGFLRHPSIQSSNPLPGWVKLDGNNTWEFADWLTVTKLEDLLGHRLLTSAIEADVGRLSSQATRSLVMASGPLVALVSSAGAFKEILDRQTVLESLARQAVWQSTDPA